MSNFRNAVKKHYQQFLLVFMAFLSLSVIGYYYVDGINNKTLESHALLTLATANAELTTLFAEADTALGSMAYVINEQYKTHGDEADYRTVMQEWALTLIKRLTYYKNFSGARAVVDGAFYCSSGYTLPDDYIISDEEWYKGAAANPGKVFITDFYKDIFTGDEVLSLSVALTNQDNEIYAVLSVEVKNEEIQKIINRFDYYGAGYCFVLNAENKYILHNSSEYLNRTLSDVTKHKDTAPVKRFIAMVEAGDSVHAHRMNDYDDTKVVVFSSKAVNNWTLALVIPSSAVFASINDMLFVMIVMGFMLVLMVGYFMTLLTFEKMRSDEENQNKSSFLAKMSHELRTPLNAVLGMSELILREDIPRNIYDNAQSIKQASTNLISIINDILDYSKIESGRLEIIQGDYYFSSLINDVVSIIRMRLTDKPIKMIVNIDVMTPNNLIGDEVRVRQVLINILSNAVKYTKEGSIALDVYGEIRGEDQYDFVIDVTDTGIGIKEEDISKLFGDFVQINMAANKGVEGTGLGLVIARNICRAMGGDITVKSVYGKGSTFSIKFTQGFRDYKDFAHVDDVSAKSTLLYETRQVYSASIAKTLKNLAVPFSVVQNQNQFYEELKKGQFPFVFVSSFLYSSAKNIIDKLETETKIVIISEYGEVVTAKCDRVIEMPAHCVAISNILNNIVEDTENRDSADVSVRFIAPTASVLIVDDIATNLKVAEGLMSPYGMKIDTAMSGAEAIERIRKTRYDIVFMDHMMPGMDGIEATERIRKLDPSDDFYVNLPIVALTAVAISGVKEMFLQNGLNDFLAKPIEMAKLNVILEKWIPKDKQEKEIVETDVKDDVSIDIKGIDVKVGLSMTGGQLSTYIRVLDIFVKDCAEKMEQITHALASNDLILYTTHVHALKSAAANVGALQVSELAKHLEIAGKSEDIVFITDNNDEFFAAVKSLIEEVKPVLQELKEVNESETDDEFDISLLRTDLTTLKTALEEMDIGKIDSIVTQLQSVKMSADIRDLLEEIFRAIIMFEYQEATEKIDDILEQ